MKRKILLLLVSFLALAVAMQAQGFYNNRYQQQLDEQYTSGLFRGSNGYMLVPKDDPSSLASLTIFQYIQGRVPGLIINNNNLYAPSASWRMGATNFYLNEVRVDASVLASIPINDIGLVKIFRPLFAGAIGNGSGGAIALYLMREDEEEE